MWAPILTIDYALQVVTKVESAVLGCLQVVAVGAGDLRCAPSQRLVTGGCHIGSGRMTTDQGPHLSRYQSRSGRFRYCAASTEPKQCKMQCHLPTLLPE